MHSNREKKVQRQSNTQWRRQSEIGLNDTLNERNSTGAFGTNSAATGLNSQKSAHALKGEEGNPVWIPDSAKTSFVVCRSVQRRAAMTGGRCWKSRFNNKRDGIDSVMGNKSAQSDTVEPSSEVPEFHCILSQSARPCATYRSRRRA